MKTRFNFKLIALALLALLTINSQLSTALAQNTAFTYQGRLNNNGAAANGNYDLTFTLYSSPGIVVGPVTNLMTAVSNGLFTTTIDFGAAVFINYSNSLLEIGVRTNGAGSFNILSPQQPLTRIPYALTALNAGSVAATNISGIILNSSLPPSPAFSGANVTNVNAAALGGLNKTNFWQIGGNSGTTVGVNFIGTTDNQPLELRAGGNVGINTANPLAPLTVNGSVIVDSTGLNNGFPIANGLTFGGLTGEGIGSVRTSGNADQNGLNFYTDYIKRLTILNNGNVGINTTNPQSELSVVLANPGGRGAELSLVNPAASTVGNEVAINFGTDPSSYGGDGGNAQIKVRSVNVNNASDMIFSTYNGSSFGERMRIQNGGNVGIGTSSPQQKLDVNGEFMVAEGLGNEQAYIGGDGLGNDAQVGSLNSTVTSLTAWNAATSAYMNFRCSSITIEGGSDLAEPFKISTSENDVPEGSVVVIDVTNPGHLKLSDRPYDSRVAGVVSGANGIHPGIQMQQQGLLEGGKNVALTGRVYVQADDSNGPIQPGDLLTTSNEPGCAMKVTDHLKAQGAILGKAMTALKEGKGMVLVLVTLQ
jgi:hypothetical protein